MDGVSLGLLVTFIHRSSHYYSGIFHTSGKKTMAKSFRVFCDRNNYPIYFHCIGGAEKEIAAFRSIMLEPSNASE